MNARRLVTLVLLAASLGLLAGPAASAQDASPVATPGGPSAGYPVAIHQGTCASPSADVAWDLDTAIGVGVTDVATPNESSLGTVQGPPILAAMSTIEVNLDDLGNEPYVIVVHASSSDETIVACGTIGGLKTNGKLAISFAPTNGSTVVGVAILEENGDQTNATVYVFDQAATPGGTPAA